MTDANILSDPIYQLNLALWLLETLPIGAAIRPLLRETGFSLESIARPLPLDPSVRLQVANSGLNVGQEPKPDVLANDDSQTRFLLIECKGRAFTTGSVDSSRQARSLLIVSDDLAGALALSPTPPRKGTVTYLTVDSEADTLQRTLLDLRGELNGHGLPASQAAVLGISQGEDGVYLSTHAPAGALPADLETALSEPQRVHHLQPGEDPAPLYFIPWDPSVDQTRTRAQQGLRILQERVRMAALSVIGRSTAPGEVLLDIDELLDEATFQMFKRWRGRDEVKGVQRESRGFLERLLSSAEVQITRSGNPYGLRLKLESEDQREKVLDHLRKSEAEIGAEAVRQMELPAESIERDGGE